MNLSVQADWYSMFKRMTLVTFRRTTSEWEERVCLLKLLLDALFT